MTIDRPSSNPSSPEEAVWYALKPEIRSGALRLSDLRQLVETGQMRGDDLIWHVRWNRWVSAQDVPVLFLSSQALKTYGPGSHLDSVDKRPARFGILKARAKRELYSFAVIAMYLWAILSFLKLHEALVLANHQLDFKSQGLVIFTALIMAKVLAIGEALHLGDRLRIRIPAFTILIKSFLFAIALIGFHFLEHVVSAVWIGHELRAALPELNSADVKRSLLITGIVTLSLVHYFVFKELEKLTGRRDLVFQILGFRQ